MRTPILTLALALLTTVPLRAQSPERPPCGDLPGAEAILEQLAPYFADDAHAGIRESLGIERLPADFPRRVVEDQRTCGRVFGALMRLRGRSGERGGASGDGFRFAVFRFGSCYGILTAERQAGEGEFPDRIHEFARSPLYLFRADGMEYVGGIMQ